MEQPSSKALFTPAKTQRASEAIYNQIYPKIISGELRPGDRLPPERELAEMFQRSRPVVREALRMLQQEGLIETAVGSSGGAVIRGVSLKSVEEPLKNLVAMGAINLDELLEYRHINDRSCARLAAIHHTEEDAEALRQTLEGAKANLDSLFSFQEYDVAFHSALAKASHNTLASLINDVIVRLNTDVFVERITHRSSCGRSICGSTTPITPSWRPSSPMTPTGRTAPWRPWSGCFRIRAIEQARSFTSTAARREKKRSPLRMRGRIRILLPGKGREIPFTNFCDAAASQKSWLPAGQPAFLP